MLGTTRSFSGLLVIDRQTTTDHKSQALLLVFAHVTR